VPLQKGRRFFLCDGHQRLLGKLLIDQVEADRVSGQFAAAADFALVQHLFAEFVEAVNQQLFHTVDELDRTLAALGLHLVPANGVRLPEIYDV